jgi:hypothetical protein
MARRLFGSLNSRPRVIKKKKKSCCSTRISVSFTHNTFSRGDMCQLDASTVEGYLAHKMQPPP